MLEDLSSAFLNRLIQEQKLRDEVFGQGDFAESAMLEHLHRYWLESALYQIGCRNISREVVYPKDSTEKQDRRACDLKAFHGQSEYWIELKVALADTNYKKEALTLDIERLSKLGNKFKLYVVVFITQTENPSSKLEHIIKMAELITNEIVLVKSPIPTPKTKTTKSNINWNTFKNPHIHVLCIKW